MPQVNLLMNEHRGRFMHALCSLFNMCHCLHSIIISAVGPLGMEDGSITNEQITASSYWQGKNNAFPPGWVD